MLFKQAAGYLLAAAVAFSRPASARVGSITLFNTEDGIPSGKPDSSEAIPGGIGTVELDGDGEAASDGDAEPEAAELLYTPEELYVDKLCVDYCDDYFNVYCVHSNTFLDGKRRRRLQEAGERDPQRALVETQESVPQRGDDWTDALQQCQQECMKWPRGENPMEFWDVIPEDPTHAYMFLGKSFNSNLGGDTFWCRQRHMTMIGVFADDNLNGFGLPDDFQGGFQSAAAFHCSFTGLHGAGICRDSSIQGVGGSKAMKSPYEWMRDGQPSRQHLGYCDILGSGTIADCTAMNTIGNFNLFEVLASFPETTEIIFMNGIEFITNLPANVFSTNLKAPNNLRAIYMNQCNLQSVDALALAGLPNLEIFNIDENVNLDSIPGTLFANNPKLKQFSMFQSDITSVPVNLFSTTPDIERIVLYCRGDNRLASLPNGIFDGLKKLNMISFVFCDIDSTLFSDDFFDDLESLQWFDFFDNPSFTVLKNRWFNCNGCGPSKMGKELLRFALWGTGLTDATIGDRVFQNLDKLETVWLYNTAVTYSGIENKLYLDDKDNFEHLALGTPIAFMPTASPIDPSPTDG